MKLAFILHWLTMMICLSISVILILTYHNIWAAVFLVLAITASAEEVSR